MDKDLSKVEKVLFVCTGNSCRSPMAEGLFNHFSAGKWQSASAGTASFEGLSVSHDAMVVMKEHGIDLSKHRSQSLSREMMDQYDLIVVMEESHRRKVCELNEQAQDKLFFLKEFDGSGEKIGIPDPVGLSLEYYRECCLAIKSAVEGLIAKLGE